MRVPITVFVFVLVCGTAAAQVTTTSACPSVGVVGPAGVTRPGDLMIFTTNPPLKEREGLSFHWTISEGTIIKGQATQVIEIRTTRELNNKSVTATIKISGLPENCRNEASESAAVSSGFHPVEIDEFGNLPRNDVRGRLDAFLYEVSRNNDQAGFIVLRASSGKSRDTWLKQRLSLIRSHIFDLRKFSRQRIVICSEPGEMEYIVLWRSARDNIPYFCPSGLIH